MIRPLDEKDIDQFIKIRKDSLSIYPKSFGADPSISINRESTIQDLKSKTDENFILGYFDQSELVGIIGFLRYLNPKTCHKAFIWGVFVYDEYRDKRIGSQLMKACIDKAKNIEGLEKIILGSSHISDAAIKLYQKFGFEVYGREKNAMIVDGEYIDEILFEKFM